ncbi:hypothetical protein N7470_001383 [Penicillium chermesinum]|nr:hypothetical protein N7470_001383 [Penicillium chermesinum]
MEVKTHIELPEKHLLNLAPRPQQQTQYQAYRADYNYSAAPCTDEPVQRHSHQVPLDASPRTSTEITFQKNVTKLPVPSSISDRARDQRNNTPSPTGIPKPLSSATLSSTTTNTPSQGRNEINTGKSLETDTKKDRLSPIAPTDKKLSSVQPDDAPMNDELSSRGASPRSTIPSPKSTIPSPSITKISRGTPNILRAPSPQLDRNTRWSKKNGGWVSLESQDGLPSRSDSAGARSESSPHSRCPSVSPISDVSSVTDCDWEDRFVVHMPSAKDPNPPTMTTEEIADYQSNLSSDKIRRHDKLRRSPPDYTRQEVASR